MFGWLARSLRRAGLLAVDPAVFVRARLAAETAVWSRAGGFSSNVRLEDIGRRLRLEPEAVVGFAEAERDLHVRTLRPSPPAGRILAAARSEGVQVVYASDTMLTAAEVEAVLRRNGLWVEGASCFTSSDTGMSKQDGTLYGHIAGRLGCDPRRILHVGDNHAVDVVRAREAGLSARWLPDGLMTPHERRLTSHSSQSAGLSDALAGAARLVRLERTARDEQRDALVRVASAVAAPLLVGYMLWVLARARDHGVGSLWVPSDDTQVLLHVGRALAGRLGMDLPIAHVPAGPGPVGIVDAWGGARAVRAWESLAPPDRDASKLFVLGLTAAQDAPEPEWLPSAESWLFDEWRDIGLRPVRGLVPFARSCCAPDPALAGGAPVSAPPSDASPLGLVRLVAIEVAEIVELDGSLVDPDADLRDAVVDTVDAFWRYPSRPEALAWGSLARPPARPYSLWRLGTGTLRGTFPDLSAGHWYEGALVQSRGHVRVMLRALERAYRRVRKLRGALAARRARARRQ